jgi:hypothetical protein
VKVRGLNLSKVILSSKRDKSNHYTFEKLRSFWFRGKTHFKTFGFSSFFLELKNLAQINCDTYPPLVRSNGFALVGLGKQIPIPKYCSTGKTQ